MLQPAPHPLKYGVPITQPAPTLLNLGFLLHSSFQELYLCSVILFPQKPQVVGTVSVAFQKSER